VHDWPYLVGCVVLLIAAGFGAALWPSMVESVNAADDLAFCQVELFDTKAALSVKTDAAALAASRWRDWQSWAEDANKARIDLAAALEQSRAELFAARMYQEGLSQKLTAAQAREPETVVVAIPYPVRKVTPVIRRKRAKPQPQMAHPWLF